MKSYFLLGACLFALSLSLCGMPLALARNAPASHRLPTAFLHPLFTSHMVLQRDADDPVWGWTTPGTRVTVVVRNESSRSLQTKAAVAGPDGRWEVIVGPFAQVPGNRAYSLVITADHQPAITLTDVLMGDVWLCSGQSNMARSLAPHYGIPDVLNQDAEIADTRNFPRIRQYYVANLAATVSQIIPTDIVSDETGKSGPWLVNNPAAASAPSRYSAVAYFFARELTQKLGVPIGIIQMSWGGTPIQAWIDPATLAADPDYAPAVAKLPESHPGRDYPGAIYNGKVAAITSFRMKGVIWYQGENNAKSPQSYGALLPLLLKSWRSHFGEPHWPFIIIQLPNYADDNWPVIREAQRETVAQDTNSRLIVTIDLGDANQVHPADKQDVAHRAALAALNFVYDQNLVASGPVITHAILRGETVCCSFAQVGAGLMVGQREVPPRQPLRPTVEVPGGILTGFELAGPDGRYFPAQAKITGQATVQVSCPGVKAPVAVRYAWAGAPVCNLYNQIRNRAGKIMDGLPASPFRLQRLD